MDPRNHKFVRQAIVYVLVFSVSYIVSGLLTPRVQNMTFADLGHNISRGISVSWAAASTK
jgi:hypothetical protein